MNGVQPVHPTRSPIRTMTSLPRASRTWRGSWAWPAEIGSVVPAGAKHWSTQQQLSWGRDELLEVKKATEAGKARWEFFSLAVRAVRGDRVMCPLPVPRGKAGMLIAGKSNLQQASGRPCPYLITFGFACRCPRRRTTTAHASQPDRGLSRAARRSLRLEGRNRNRRGQSHVHGVPQPVEPRLNKKSPIPDVPPGTYERVMKRSEDVPLLHSPVFWIAVAIVIAIGVGLYVWQERAAVREETAASAAAAADACAGGRGRGTGPSPGQRTADPASDARARDLRRARSRRPCRRWTQATRPCSSL